MKNMFGYPPRMVVQYEKEFRKDFYTIYISWHLLYVIIDSLYCWSFTFIDLVAPKGAVFNEEKSPFTHRIAD